jgi:hypothetical protein
MKAPPEFTAHPGVDYRCARESLGRGSILGLRNPTPQRALAVENVVEIEDTGIRGNRPLRLKKGPPELF